jgi:hypothetical protein
MTRAPARPRQPGRVYMVDLRAAGQCLNPPVKTWCAANGIDWRAFTRDGVPQEVLTATGDELAARVVAVAQRREASGG